MIQPYQDLCFQKNIIIRRTLDCVCDGSFRGAETTDRVKKTEFLKVITF